MTYIKMPCFKQGIFIITTYIIIQA